MARLADFYGITREELLEENADDKITGEYYGNKKGGMCPWRVKQGIDQQTGNMLTGFMPCLGKKCMAYEEGLCGMLRKTKE